MRCNHLRDYRIDASYEERGKWFKGSFVIRAYSREEAIAQFRERSCPLVEYQHEPWTISPTGSECLITCEPSESK